MSLDQKHAQLRAKIEDELEGIIDPCSHSSGAPAGLVSMGLVGGIDIEDRENGTHVKVTLYLTEPGCMMGALFQLTAQRQLAEFPGIDTAEVVMDYSHVWGPEQMAPAYQERLAKARACRAQYMREQFMTQEKGEVK